MDLPSAPAANHFSSSNRNQNTKPKAVMIKTRIAWNTDDVALVKEWCEKYPMGISFDWKRVRANHPEQWNRLLAQGRKEINIYQKGDYVRRSLLKTTPKRPSDRNYKRQTVTTASGKYACKVCGDEFKSPQSVGAHVRYAHNRNNNFPIKAKRLVGLTVGQPEEPKSTKHAAYCPHCGGHLAAVNAAMNL